VLKKTDPVPVSDAQVSLGARDRLHQQLMRVLMEEIVRGRVHQGERLPSETELASQFSASRGVVRETLRGLEERGIVSVRHGRGATVEPARSWNLLDPDVLVAVLATPASVDVLGEFLESRRILEVEAAGLAAQRASGEDLVRLGDALAQMTATAEEAAKHPRAESQFHEADVAFHAAIFAAAGNRVLARLVAPIQRALQAARLPLAHPNVRFERSLPEHKRILTAIANRDADEAREAMRSHLATIEGYLAEYAGEVLKLSAAS
jgi:GntR family transcriptional repressor for pyruvate dehydrogenase complex